MKKSIEKLKNAEDRAKKAEQQSENTANQMQELQQVYDELKERLGAINQQNFDLRESAEIEKAQVTNHGD